MDKRINKPKKIYFNYGIDLFGYYYLELFLKNKSKIQKKYETYTDSIHLVISLDKQLNKKKEKDYEIILKSS